MSDLDRRLFESGSPFERQLLEASDGDQPSPALEEKILASLTALPATASFDAESSQVRPVFQATARSRFVRPVAVATLALGLLIGGSLLVNSQTPTAVPASPPAGPVLAPSPSPSPSPSNVDHPVEVPTVTPEALPTIAPPPDPAQKPAPTAGRARSIATSQNMRPDTASSLEREIALLDAVKSKLGAGAAADASHALDTYDAEFPQGTLRPEATVLRIRTLLLQGRRDEAQRLADDFLAKHPGSVHAKRIRALLGG